MSGMAELASRKGAQSTLESSHTSSYPPRCVLLSPFVQGKMSKVREMKWLAQDHVANE